MHKLYINSGDEIQIIDLRKIAFFQSKGGFSRLHYIMGETHLLAFSISKIEEFIRRTCPSDEILRFVRLEQSLIVNLEYLTEINIQKQQITLSDNEGHSYLLSVPNPLMKELTDAVNKSYLKQ